MQPLTYLIPIAAALVTLASGWAIDRRRRDRSKPSEPEGPDIQPSCEHFGGPTIEIALYQSAALTGRNGRVPEDMAAAFLGDALRDARFNYRIRRGFDAVDPPKESARKETPWWWHPEKEPDRPAIPHAATHANILLVDAGGGGGTFGAWSVVGAQTAETPRPATASGATPEHRLGGDVLHELGWCLGVPVDDDPDMAGRQHAGTGWHDGDGWHRTPMVMAHGVENACGQPVPEREDGTTTIYENRYHWCALSHFQIDSGGDTGQNGDS